MGVPADGKKQISKTSVLTNINYIIKLSVVASFNLQLFYKLDNLSCF